jgi:hypothetical protein
MQRARLFLITAVLAFAADAASGAFVSKPPLIGATDVLPLAVAFDGAGNRYVAGNAFLPTADFDPGKDVQTRPVIGQGSEPFVTRFDASGNWVWTQTFGGTGTDQVTGIAVSNGAVYVCGTFESNDAGFGAVGTVSAHYDGANFGAGFVLALDPATGAPLTAFNGTGVQTFGGSGGGRAGATCVYAFGTNLYVGGSFTSFGFGIGGSGGVNSTGQADGFVAALDGTTGAARTGFSADGLQTFAGNGNESPHGMRQTDGVLFVGGTMSSTNFGVGATGAVASAAQYDEDAFVVALQASSGGVVAAFGGDGIVTLAGSATDEGWALDAATGVVYLAGLTTAASPTVDGAPSPVTAVGGRDAFVLALDGTTGAKVAGFGGGLVYLGSAQDETLLTSVAAAPAAVFVSGVYGEPASPGTGPGDAFVAALGVTDGGPLAGFGTAGVQTITGGELSGDHQHAQILGLAAGTPGVAFVGTVVGKGFLGAPATKTSFPGDGGFLVLLDAATGDPLNMGANQRPVAPAPPIATPNPAVVGKPVKFRGIASDPDGDKLRFAWEFGDDGTSAAKSPSIRFTTPGTHGARFTAIDARGGATPSPALSFEVVAPGTPYFDVAKLAVALKFSRSGADSITLSGQFPLADGTALAGKSVTIDVGGVSRTFTLDAKGRSPKGVDAAAVKPPKGGVAKFTASFRKGDFAAALQDEGLSNATVANVYAPTLVTVTFDGAGNAETFQLVYAAKQGRSGTAR